MSLLTVTVRISGRSYFLLTQRSGCLEMFSASYFSAQIFRALRTDSSVTVLSPFRRLSPSRYVTPKMRLSARCASVLGDVATPGPDISHSKFRTVTNNGRTPYCFRTGPASGISHRARFDSFRGPRKACRPFRVAGRN